MSDEQTTNTTQDQVNDDTTSVQNTDIAEETPVESVEETGEEITEEKVEEPNDVATEEEKEEAVVATNTKTPEKKLPEFRAGDTVRISYKIIEGDKTRLQPYEGIVISVKGSDVSRTFTVRKIGADNVGVERIFPICSPNIESIKVVKRGKVRRAKLYYLRDKKGKEAKTVRERK